MDKPHSEFHPRRRLVWRGRPFAIRERQRGGRARLVEGSIAKYFVSGFYLGIYGEKFRLKIRNSGMPMGMPLGECSLAWPLSSGRG